MEFGEYFATAPLLSARLLHVSLNIVVVFVPKILNMFPHGIHQYLFVCIVMYDFRLLIYECSLVLQAVLAYVRSEALKSREA
jgi:hypothetical protein